MCAGGGRYQSLVMYRLKELRQVKVSEMKGSEGGGGVWGGGRTWSGASRLALITWARLIPS